MGETSNMNVFNGENEHDEKTVPAAYTPIGMAPSDDAKEIELSRSKQRETPTDTGRAEGNETVAARFANIADDAGEDPLEDPESSGAKETDLFIDIKKDNEFEYEEKKHEGSDDSDSDTDAMYEENEAAIPNSVPGSLVISQIADLGPGSNPIDSGLVILEKEENSKNLKLKNMDSLDDLYESEEDETPGHQTQKHED